MSYILEALKKAQAERQIGSTPTIHAPTLASMPAGQGARSKRTPVIVAMVLMAGAIAGLAAMLVRQQTAASQTPAPGAPLAAAQPAAASQRPAAALPIAAGPAPAAVQPAAASQAPSIDRSAAAGAPSANAAAAEPSSAKRADAGPPAAANVAAPVPALAHGASQAPAAHAPVQPPVVPKAAAAEPVPAPVSAPAPVEEQVQSLRDLPEPIQRAIPQITLGGYMYSKNPADRLLLIDKVLRREGEEVAPGLVLEKLQPKQAIFGFRGYRYRVAL
jgi:general secretion pathway protein B